MENWTLSYLAVVCVADTAYKKLELFVVVPTRHGDKFRQVSTSAPPSGGTGRGPGPTSAKN